LRRSDARIGQFDISAEIFVLKSYAQKLRSTYDNFLSVLVADALDNPEPVTCATGVAARAPILHFPPEKMQLINLIQLGIK
jgi:hypothetical protein